MMNPLFSFFLILCAILAYGALHSFLAAIEVKQVIEQAMGDSRRKYYRLIYNLIATITLFPLLALVARLPGQVLYTVPMPARLLMLGLQLLSIAGFLMAVAQTGAFTLLGLTQLLNPNSLKKPPVLVKTGFYRWVRHPIYSFGIAILWLSPWMTSNILAFNLGITIYILVGAMLEEKKLIIEYGEAYLEYKRQTPMLIPLPSRKQN